MNTNHAESVRRAEDLHIVPAAVSIPLQPSSVVAAYVKRGDGFVGTRISTSA